MFSLIDVKTERSDIYKILHISEKLRKSIILFYFNFPHYTLYT